MTKWAPSVVTIVIFACGCEKDVEPPGGTNNNGTDSGVPADGHPGADGGTHADGSVVVPPDGGAHADGSVIVPPDGGTSADGGVVVFPDGGTGICVGHGGICMDWHWEMCPVGYEPYLDDQPLDCNGRCCVPAPFSTCTNDPNGNCLLGTQCPACWLPEDPALTCEAGRVCCYYACD